MSAGSFAELNASIGYGADITMTADVTFASAIIIDSSVTVTIRSTTRKVLSGGGSTRLFLVYGSLIVRGLTLRDGFASSVRCVTAPIRSRTRLMISSSWAGWVDQGRGRRCARHSYRLHTFCQHCGQGACVPQCTKLSSHTAFGRAERSESTKTQASQSSTQRFLTTARHRRCVRVVSMHFSLGDDGHQSTGWSGLRIWRERRRHRFDGLGQHRTSCISESSRSSKGLLILHRVAHSSSITRVSQFATRRSRPTPRNLCVHIFSDTSLP